MPHRQVWSPACWIPNRWNSLLSPSRHSPLDENGSGVRRGNLINGPLWAVKHRIPRYLQRVWWRGRWIAHKFIAHWFLLLWHIESGENRVGEPLRHGPFMLRPTVVKTRGWMGCCLESLSRVCLFPLRVHSFARVYTRHSMEEAQCQGKKKGLLSGARVGSKLAPLLLCGDIRGFRQECSVTLSRFLGAPATQSWTFTPCAWQPALGDWVWVSRQTCAA